MVPKPPLPAPSPGSRVPGPRGTRAPPPGALKPTEPDWLAMRDTAHPSRRSPRPHGSLAQEAGPYIPTLHVHVLNLICQREVSFFPACSPISQCLFIIPGSVSYRLFQRSQKQHLNSITEHHVMIFVLQNEPWLTLGGRPWLLNGPQLNGGSWPG